TISIANDAANTELVVHRCEFASCVDCEALHRFWVFAQDADRAVAIAGECRKLGRDHPGIRKRQQLIRMQGAGTHLTASEHTPLPQHENLAIIGREPERIDVAKLDGERNVALVFFGASEVPELDFGRLLTGGGKNETLRVKSRCGSA